MANKFARSNGNFDHPIWALTSSGVAGSTTPPALGDTASANTFTVTITGDVAVDALTNGNQYGGSIEGKFIVSGTINLSGNVSSGATMVYVDECLNISGSNKATIYGNVSLGGAYSGSRTISYSSSEDLIIYGNLTNVADGGAARVIHQSGGSGSIIVYGNLISGATGGSSSSHVIQKDSGTGNIIIYGDVGGSQSKTGNQGILYNTTTGGIEVYGNVYGSYGVGIVTSSSSTFIQGTVTGGPGSTGAYGLRNNGTGNVIVNGNATAINATAIYNNSTGPVIVYGNLLGGTPTQADARAIHNISTAPVTVYGNIVGRNAEAILNASTGSITVFSETIEASGLGGHGIESLNAGARVIITAKNIINAANGVSAIYSPSYILNSLPGETPIEANIAYAGRLEAIFDNKDKNYQFVSTAFSTFSTPPASSVRLDVAYGSKTGTCVIPPVSAVAFGVMYDTDSATMGTVTNISNTVFNTPISAISVSGSIGEMLKRSSTIEATGHLIASFSK